MPGQPMETPEERAERENKFWEKLTWELTSCDEAAVVFPEMVVCPVCNAMLTKVEGDDEVFVMVHKSLEELFN